MKPVRLLSIAGGAVTMYVLAATGALTVDLGVGRRRRPLGPLRRDVAAPPEIVFDVIAGPYLGKTPRAMGAELRVVERGTDMVLAEHFTPIGLGLTATTLEIVRFERPHRVTFHLARGPVPYVTETFELAAVDGGTEFTYRGEIGADLWAFGAWWAGAVGARWEQAVATSIAGIAGEAERRAARRAAPV